MYMSQLCTCLLWNLLKFWKFLCLIFLGGLCRTDERIGSNGSESQSFLVFAQGSKITRAISIMILLCSCLLVPHNLLIDFRYMKVFRMFRLLLYLYVYIVCCIVFVFDFEERRFGYLKKEDLSIFVVLAFEEELL